jgi:hypothetical protein
MAATILQKMFLRARSIVVTRIATPMIRAVAFLALPLLAGAAYAQQEGDGRGLAHFGDRGLTSFGDTPLAPMGGLKVCPPSSRSTTGSHSCGRIVVQGSQTVARQARTLSVPLVLAMPRSSSASPISFAQGVGNADGVPEFEAVRLPPVVQPALSVDSRPSIALLEELLRAEEQRARTRGDVHLARALRSAQLR